MSITAAPHNGRDRDLVGQLSYRKLVVDVQKRSLRLPHFHPYDGTLCCNRELDGHLQLTSGHLQLTTQAPDDGDAQPPHLREVAERAFMPRSHCPLFGGTILEHQNPIIFVGLEGGRPLPELRQPEPARTWERDS